jgi:calcineurin-like phosphoesterase family protein
MTRIFVLGRWGITAKDVLAVQVLVAASIVMQKNLGMGGPAVNVRIGESESAGAEANEVLLFRLQPPSRKPRPSTDQLATVLHVTDIHLNLSYREQSDRVALRDFLTESSALTRGHLATALALAILRGAQDRATDSSWRSLVALLHSLATRSVESTPTIIAQTGDVEAFGANAAGRHPGFETLLNDVWPKLRELGVTCIDVFGNHDIWPHLLLGENFGDLIAIGPLRLAQEHESLMGPWNEIRVATRDGDPDIVVHRVSTVSGSTWAALSARGRICQEPVPPNGDLLPDIMTRLRDRLKETDVVHIVLSHHPLYRVPDITATRRFIASVRGGADVRAVLDDQVLVLSGHLHHLHPPIGEKGDTPQIVGDKPTLPRHRNRAPKFAQYFLVRRDPTSSEVPDDFTQYIRIDRAIYTYSRSQRYGEPPVVESDTLLP